MLQRLLVVHAVEAEVREVVEPADDGAGPLDPGGGLEDGLDDVGIGQIPDLGELADGFNRFRSPVFIVSGARLAAAKNADGIVRLNTLAP